MRADSDDISNFSRAPGDEHDLVGERRFPHGKAQQRWPSPTLEDQGDRVHTSRIYMVEVGMDTARLFRCGNSQAVRLPKQFRLKSKEVEVFRRGDEIVLREKNGTMVRAFDLLASLPEDLVIAGREKDHPQKRKGL
jgi:antitoxin VapB